MRSNHRQVFRFIVFSAVLGLGMGCGKSKLTDDQKAQVQTTAAHVNSVTSSSTSAGDDHNPAVNPPPSASAVSHSSANDDSDRMLAALNAADHKCIFDTASPGPGTPTGTLSLSSMNFHVKIAGNDCPIAMDFSLAIDASGQNGSLGCSYSVKDDGFRRLNDIDAISVSGPVSVSKIDLSGQIHSQSKGSIGLKVEAERDDDGKSGTLKLTYEFPDFTAELKAETDNNQTKYSVNGEDLSEAQFMKYVANMGII